ncbi:MAG: helix-turn-helix domain-containing protein [Anaeromyxobacteraceae bacterium]
MTPAPPRYSELPPPPALARWVASVWELRGVAAAGGERHRVLPDGCIDLMFTPDRPSATQLVGPMSTAVEVPLEGEVDVLGLRLRPGGHVLLGALDARALVDLMVEPAAQGTLLRDRALALARGIETRPSLAERASRIWAALLPLASTAPPPDPLLEHALRRWSREPATVRELVRDSGYTERTLERRFLAAAGFRPAELRRLARFRAVLRRHAAGDTRWAALAAAAGYADQAHLTREFRSFAGVSPSAWAAEQAGVGIVQDGRVAAL